MAIPMTPPEIDNLLARGFIGRLACHAEGRSYLVPMSYVYEDKAIYCHTGEGRKVEMLRKNPQACFEVEELKGPTRWRSAIVWGEYQELSGEARDRALQLLASKVAGVLSPTERDEAAAAHGSGQGSDADGLVVFRILIDESSGRSEGG